MSTERKATFFIGHDLRRLVNDPKALDPYIGPLPGNSWPEHITIIPPIWELENEKPERLFERLARTAATLHSFDVTPIGDASFDGTTPVTLVDGAQALHYMLVGLFDTNGYTNAYVSREFIGPDYNGHTSHLDGVLPPRQPVHVDSISIFRNVNGKKFVDRRIKLREN